MRAAWQIISLHRDCIAPGRRIALQSVYYNNNDDDNDNYYYYYYYYHRDLQSVCVHMLPPVTHLPDEISRRRPRILLPAP